MFWRLVPYVQWVLPYVLVGGTLYYGLCTFISFVSDLSLNSMSILPMMMLCINLKVVALDFRCKSFQ